MSGTAATEMGGGDAAPVPKPARKRGRILLALPLLLGVIGAGLWYGGLLGGVLSIGGVTAAAHPASDPLSAPKPPTFVELPEIISNLNTAGRRAAYVKVHARLELVRAEDQAVVAGVMPRLQDLFQTYLREMRPDELRGSAGVARLREELLARANIAASPARVSDVLFTDLLVQ